MSAAPSERQHVIDGRRKRVRNGLGHGEQVTAEQAAMPIASEDFGPTHGLDEGSAQAGPASGLPIGMTSSGTPLSQLGRQRDEGVTRRSTRCALALASSSAALGRIEPPSLRTHLYGGGERVSTLAGTTRDGRLVAPNRSRRAATGASELVFSMSDAGRPTLPHVLTLSSVSALSIFGHSRNLAHSKDYTPQLRYSE